MLNDCTNSIILVDKPSGLTSFDVIKKLKQYTNIKKIGHAGVLDKLASGLLVCATNRATKLLSIFENGYKIYEAEILFGIKTDTYDISGEMIAKRDSITVDVLQLKSVLSNFIGNITQEPPIYSNIKIGGKRLYKYALEKKEVRKPKRVVTVYDIEIIKIMENTARLRIKCSKGTYIRTLANDIGEKLGSYGCVKSLRRIFIYPFGISKASKLDDIQCLHIDKALDFLPSIRVEDEVVKYIENGVNFCRMFNCGNLQKGFYKVFVGNMFIAIIEKTLNNKVIYRFVLPNE